MHYHRPRCVGDALELLGDGAAKPLVGGTDLIVGMRHRLLTPERVVDLKRIEDFPAPLTVEPDGIRIGALATLASLAADPRVFGSYRALAEGAGWVGSVQIRNRATLVGNVCNGSPVGDTLPALLVHGAVARIAAVDGARDVPLAEFFIAPRRTRCAPTELVTSVWVPTPPAHSASAYLRLTRRHGVDLATVSAAACVDESGRVVLGLGAVGPRPLVVELPERVDPLDEKAVSAGLDVAMSVATPITDVRSTREYRAAMVRELARRAVGIAARRTWGGPHE